jgi:hypothetical protein
MDGPLVTSDAGLHPTDSTIANATIAPQPPIAQPPTSTYYYDTPVYYHNHWLLQ